MDQEMLAKIKLGQLIVADELAMALPLQRTAVDAQIKGPVVNAVIRQYFSNPLLSAADLEYLYPLPENAAITGFEVTVGDRRIVGNLRELEQARQVYEEARQAGQKAGLFEQRRPNLYAVKLANVLPGEALEASIHFQQKLGFEDGCYEWVLPMGVTPKYTSPDKPEEAAEVHVVLAQASEKIGPVEITVAVDAGVAVETPQSPSHALAVTRLDARRFQVRLGQESIPDRDFVLRYALSGQQVGTGVWVSRDAKGGELFLATLVPPALEEELEVSPREFIFVLDRSGSMSGEPILQARNALRACLRSLNPGDRFNVLLFDDQLEWYSREMMPVNQAQVERADFYLEKVEGRGGTEIVQAIQEALSQPADKKYARFIVFLTDGAVSAEESALKMVRTKIGAGRLFTFGIGSSVNRALLSRMARVGRGRAEFLQLNEDIEGSIIRFQDRVSFPLLTQVALEWHNLEAWDVYPTAMPDLYAGQPLELCGRLRRKKGGAAWVEVKGQRASQTLTLRLDFPAAAEADETVERLWARARVDDLMEQIEMGSEKVHELRNEVIGLAIDHRLVTTFTAFVAVEEQVSFQGGEKKTVVVSQALPHGLNREPFTAGPRTAGMPPMSARPVYQPMRSVSATSAPLIDASNLNIPVPAFLRRRVKAAEKSFADNFSTGAPAPMEAEEAAPGAAKLETGLRWLARKQRVDGSWEGDVEWTAAALLAFVRGGHTTRNGDFRQALRRAVSWLIQAKSDGLAAFVRLLALHELALATGQDEHHQAVQAALAALGQPQTPFEEAVLARVQKRPLAVTVNDIRTLEDLRLAAVTLQTRPVPPELQPDERVRLWMTVLAPR